MLTNLQKNIRLKAHYAAQREIENYIDGETPFGPLSAHQRRQKILDLLEENSFSRFLLRRNEAYEVLELADYSQVQTEKDQDASFYAYRKFSVSEVQAYLEFLGNYTPGKLFADAEECLEYIRDEFGCEGMQGGPGRPFNTGWGFYLTKSQKRIVGNYMGGLDI